MKNFFRKVAFGISPNEEVPSDPLKWAQNQVLKSIINRFILFYQFHECLLKNY